ncbi:MAG: RNA polymerase sigma factor [Deltaproteobacteria bacterium]|nr:RNA polymerase sigma factor [Nannocystaceae bacterium]
MAETDEQLLTAWRAGDHDAAEQLMRRHFAVVYRFLRNKLPDEVEEVAQRTFLACVESADRFRGESSFRGYLLGIARKQLMLALRRKHRAAKVFDPERMSMHELDDAAVPSPTGVLARQQSERVLLLALRRLPLDFQITLELFYWEELPIADIAVVLEIAVGTVKSRMNRARTMLRAQIETIAAAPALAHETITEFGDWIAAMHRRIGDDAVPAAVGDVPERPDSEG